MGGLEALHMKKIIQYVDWTLVTTQGITYNIHTEGEGKEGWGSVCSVRLGVAT